MIDPFGAVLAFIRDDSAVTAIASTRVSSEVADTLPCVRLVDSVSSPTPFGPGSGRLGLISWSGIAQCYGDDSPTGAITARQLAAAVSDALHIIGTRHLSGSRVQVKSSTPTLDGIDRDPDTKWPLYTVRIDAIFVA